MRVFLSLTVCFLLLAVTGCDRSTQTASMATARAPASRQPASATPTTAGPAHHAFATLPDRGELARYDPAVTRREGAYTWHRVDLSERHALNAIADGELHFQTPSGERLDIQYDHVIEHPSGDWTWVGHVAGHDDAQTIITFGDKAAFGTIGRPDAEPLRLSVRDGVSWVVVTDPAMLAATPNASGRGTRPDFLVVPPKQVSGVNAPQPSAAPMAPAAAPTMSSATTSSTPTVDVVIGYTPGFATANNGTSGAVTRLNYLVDVTNETYRNSQIVAQARLVATVPVNYPDATSNDTTLEQLTGYSSASNSRTSPDSAFNALRMARDQYGADMVALVRAFRDPENGGCGLGWLIGGGQQPIDQSDSYFAYSVVSDGHDTGTDGHSYYCLDETLAHEMGHGMGAAHDVETAKGDDGVLSADEYGAFPYSFGFKSTLPVNGGSAGYYTVMAYGDSGQHIYRTFSNPRTTFCGGYTCGNATQADNARTLTQTIPIVATFRATVVPVTTTAVPRILLKELDANGDGRSDLLLRGHAAGQFIVWYMAGTTRLAYNTTTLAGSYTLVGTGDLNGDHMTDLIWSSGHDVVVSMRSGNAYVNVATPYTYGDGTQIVGAADINGDGKADILLRNAASGVLVVWYMNGPNRVAYNQHSIAGSYDLVGSADMNKDGKQDLVWTNAGHQILVSFSNGFSFTSSLVGLTYADGYTLDGVTDVNGDGKGDLLFRSVNPANLVIWFMSGTSRVAYSSKAMSAAYHIVGKGDFNGDHRGDLVWTDGAGHIVMSLSTGATFSDSVLPYAYSTDYPLMDAG